MGITWDAEENMFINVSTYDANAAYNNMIKEI